MKKPLIVYIYEIFCKVESFCGEVLDNLAKKDKIADYYTWVLDNELTKPCAPIKVKTTIYPESQYGQPPQQRQHYRNPLDLMLKQAIEEEDYELAAEIRDTIKKDTNG